jgi:hypothetical protein
LHKVTLHFGFVKKNIVYILEGEIYINLLLHFGFIKKKYCIHFGGRSFVGAHRFPVWAKMPGLLPFQPASLAQFMQRQLVTRPSLTYPLLVLVARPFLFAFVSCFFLSFHRQ